MTSLVRAALGVIAMTLLAAAVGGWFGIQYGMAEARRSPPGVDAVLHQQLDLMSQQKHRLESLEAAYALRRQALQAQMHDADRQLARAFVIEHRYGPAAQQAIEQFHAAMKGLQEETIVHILAMRAVLTPAQAQRYDAIVLRVLDVESDLVQ